MIIKKIKCIFNTWMGFCCLLDQCKCANINEDEFNPFKQKL